MRSVLVIAALSLLACDAVVSERPGPARKEVRKVSCSHPGVCYECGLTFGGKYECSFGFHSFCSGNQNATVQITPIEAIRQSGAADHYDRVDVLERIGACK